MIRAAVAAVLAMVAVPTASLAAPRVDLAASLTPQAFRDRVAGAIAAVDAKANIAPRGEVDIRITRAGAADVDLNVANAYAAYRADPEKLDALVARFARIFGGMSEQTEPISQLVVVVRPSDYLTRSLAPGASQESLLPSKPMAGDVSFFLAVDSPDAIRTAVPDDLTRWRVSEAKAWTRAIANIKRRIGPLAFARLDSDPDDASGLTAASGLAPSMLASEDMCRPANPTGGIPGQVVLLYSRDTFLFGVPNDPSSMAGFWRTAKAVIADESSFSKTPLTCRGGRWTVAPIP